MKKKLTCIICPRGCTVEVTEENGSLSTFGNSCKRGEEYAVRELTHPVRTLTSSVRISNRKDTMVSVKTKSPIPKEKIFEAMEVIRDLETPAPVNAGDIIIEDFFSSSLVATKTVK